MSSPSGVSCIVGMFELIEVLLISRSSGVSWTVGSFKRGGVLMVESVMILCIGCTLSQELGKKW
jgi:hypothetical protein